MGNGKVELMIVAGNVHVLRVCADEQRGRKGRNDVSSRYR
jgi:hypothetical protein